MRQRFFTQDRIFILIVLVPVIIFVAFLIYYPAASTFQNSLTNWNLRIQKPPKFIQFDNYTKLLGDPEFWEVTLRSFKVVALILPMEMLVAFGIALLLNEHFRGRALVRTLVILPWMLPPVVNGFLWGWLLNGDYGALNGLLYQLGVIREYNYWLQDPQSQLFWAARLSHSVLVSMACSGYRSTAATQVGCRWATVGAMSERKQNVSPRLSAVIAIMSRLWPGARTMRMPGSTS